MCNVNNVMVNLNKYDILPLPRYLTIIEKVYKYSKISSIFLNGGTYKIRTNDKKLKVSTGKDMIVCKVSAIKSMSRTMYVCNNNYEKTWKVLTSRAAHGAFSGFGFMCVSEPNEVFTDSYVGFRAESKTQAVNIMSYLQTKLANYVLSSRKISQDINANVVKWIPMVPFDRLWNDQKVYEWFNLTKDDIEIIESSR